DAGAQRTRLAVQDVTHRFTGRAGLLHGAGQEPAGEFVAPAGQADGYLARGPPVELGRAARAGSGAPAAPLVDHVEQGLVREAVCRASPRSDAASSRPTGSVRRAT